MPPARLAFMPQHLLQRMLSPLYLVCSASNTGPSFSAWQITCPDGILTLLLLIGGDIVQRAVAQLAGSGPGPFCPVPFSFGWLAYSVSALTSTVGDGRLLPRPDLDMLVVNAKSGYARNNASWVLARLLRDQEIRMPTERGLTIVFYQTSTDPKRVSGIPRRDWVYWSGVLVILAQLVIAAIPGALHSDWLVLVVTAGGTLLALVGSGLGQWRDEKYAARRVEKGREVAVLTRGNGSTFAMVVISEKGGIKLEDLAAGRNKRRFVTSVMTGMLFVLWFVLLLTVASLEGDAWYLLAVSGLGMLQNVVAAGVTRSADALGLHLDTHSPDGLIADKKVMEALKQAEQREQGLGLSLLPLFFPGGLRPDEQEYWDGMRRKNTA